MRTSWRAVWDEEKQLDCKKKKKKKSMTIFLEMKVITGVQLK